MPKPEPCSRQEFPQGPPALTPGRGPDPALPTAQVPAAISLPACLGRRGKKNKQKNKTHGRVCPCSAVRRRSDRIVVVPEIPSIIPAAGQVSSPLRLTTNLPQVLPQTRRCGRSCCEPLLPRTAPAIAAACRRGFGLLCQHPKCSPFSSTSALPRGHRAQRWDVPGGPMLAPQNTTQRIPHPTAVAKMT